MVKNIFDGKVAIVTGASSGLGRELALELAKRGAKIVLASRSAGSIEDLAVKIRDLGGEALAVPTDTTEHEQVTCLVQATVKRFGAVDFLIANAGQYIRSPIKDLTVHTVERSMAVNFYGGLYSVLEVLPGMLARKSGHIVLVLTLDVKTPLVYDSPYVAAKSALSGFGDVLRQELHGSGVYVTIAYPGRIDTPMIAYLKVPMVSAKMSPHFVALEILKSVERKAPALILPFQALLLNFIYFVSPSMMDWVAAKFRLEGWTMEKLSD